MKSVDFRTDPLFLRNDFSSEGKYNFPIIRKQNMDTDHVQLISYSDISISDTKNLYKGVHFFIDDWRFESVYRSPYPTVERIRKYKFALSPDFSLFAEMPIWRQIESIGKSRWVGAFFQNCGIITVPTISWSTSTSYDFCFRSIERGSIVAIGMIGCKHSKSNFLNGYYEMMRQIEPSAIICFGTPFEEMQGNIVTVDYVDSRKVVR